MMVKKIHNNAKDNRSQDLPLLVSIHGGHSGEFCSHAHDTLEGMILAYIDRGFSWVGITEHMPPPDKKFLFPEEQKAGIDLEKANERFCHYLETCRNLQQKYAAKLRIFVGFETEVYTGYTTLVPRLVNQFKPDFIVGSVHCIEDIDIDRTPELYRQIALEMGGVDALYGAYFDQQYEMIEILNPHVVGHFDLIRIFDPDYLNRLEKPAIKQKITRNLHRIKECGLILDFNVSALRKGASEPYVSRSVLQQALELGIPVVPGDDSHSISQVGEGIKTGIDLLQACGFPTDWSLPISC